MSVGFGTEFDSWVFHAGGTSAVVAVKVHLRTNGVKKYVKLCVHIPILEGLVGSLSDSLGGTVESLHATRGQVGMPPDLGSGERGFESLRVDNDKQKEKKMAVYRITTWSGSEYEIDFDQNKWQRNQEGFQELYRYRFYEDGHWSPMFNCNKSNYTQDLAQAVGKFLFIEAPLPPRKGRAYATTEIVSCEEL